ncbi:hypothetical protein D3C77_762000 [compost metagenome]
MDVGFQPFIHVQQFINTGAAEVTRLPAFIAASGQVAGFTWNCLLLTRAERTYQALGHYTNKPSLDQMRWQA